MNEHTHHREQESELDEILNTNVNKWIPRGIVAAVGAAALLTSIYIVGPSQQGIVTQLGKYSRTTASGIHMKMPWPIESVQTPSVTEVQRIEIGFRTIDQGPPAKYEHIPEESRMLTGDENIVQSEFIVQYTIADPTAWLYNVKDPVGALRDISEAAHRQVIGDNTIDDVLTTGKARIQDLTKRRIQEISDAYRIGAAISAVQLQDVYAPEKVSGAFKEVASSKERMVEIINQARGYENEKVPIARGDAQKLIQDAEGYRAQRVNAARGDSSRFVEVLKEYHANPEITRQRLYIETLGEIYPGIEMVIIDDNSTDGLLKLLDLKQGEHK